MSETLTPARKTLRFLERSDHPLLFPVLKRWGISRNPDLALAAVRVLLERSDADFPLYVLPNWHRFSEACQTELLRGTMRIRPQVGRLLGSEEPQHVENALRFSTRAEIFEAVPQMLGVIAEREAALSDLALEAVQHLVDRLRQHLEQDGGTEQEGTYLRNAAEVRGRLLLRMYQELEQLDRYPKPGSLIVCLLTLCEASDSLLAELLSAKNPKISQLASELLRVSMNPGVFKLMIESLSENYPQRPIIKAISERSDVEFLSALLRWFPRSLTPNQIKSLQQFRSFRWTLAVDVVLPQLPENLHAPLVRLIERTNIPEADKVAVQNWVLLNGSAAGRVEAEQLLEKLDRESVEDLLQESLDSDDPNIEAWALKQVRKQGIDSAFAILMDKLDSSEEVVREAAREELSGFDLNHFRTLSRELGPTEGKVLASVVRRVHPECVEQLRKDLCSPVRSRRLDAIRIVWQMELERDLLPVLLEMTADSDAAIRREVAERLESVPEPRVLAALVELQGDDSNRVRDAAGKAIDAIHKADPALISKTSAIRNGTIALKELL